MPSSSPRSAATATHVVACAGQLGACALELLGPPGGDRQRVALLPEEVREPQPDAARGPCHDRCALRHSTPSIAAEAQYPITRRWLPCERMRSVRHVLAPLLAASALTLAACGGNEEPAAPPLRSPSRPSRPTSRPRRARRARSSSAGLTEGPVFAPSTSILNVGDNRFGFALFDTRTEDGRGLRGRDLHVRQGRIGPRRGPYPARRESFAVKSPYRSAQAAGDLANGDAFYVSTVPFKTGGQQGADRARADGRPARRRRRVPAAGPRGRRAAEGGGQGDLHAHA